MTPGSEEKSDRRPPRPAGRPQMRGSEVSKDHLRRTTATCRGRLGLAAGEQCGVVEVEGGSVPGHSPRPLLDHERLEVIR
jgi:hypothetical protein